MLPKRKDNLNNSSEDDDDDDDDETSISSEELLELSDDSSDIDLDNSGHRKPYSFNSLSSSQNQLLPIIQSEDEGDGDDDDNKDEQKKKEKKKIATTSRRSLLASSSTSSSTAQQQQQQQRERNRRRTSSGSSSRRSKMAAGGDNNNNDNDDDDEGIIGFAAAADPLVAKCIVRANRRRNLADTYTTPLTSLLEDDPMEIDRYLEETIGFDDDSDDDDDDDDDNTGSKKKTSSAHSSYLKTIHDDILIALKQYPDSVAVRHHEFVVREKSVTQADFWCRYFYKCNEKLILKDLRRRSKLGTLGQSTRNLFANSTSTSGGSTAASTGANHGFARNPTKSSSSSATGANHGYARNPTSSGSNRRTLNRRTMSASSVVSSSAGINSRKSPLVESQEES